ncbi:MAG TPA: hypothetical protein VFG83_16820 [Kofleriaceae bacterium]|nr:hypothetical protein [Kofleriaceae bacterium]
MILESIPLDHGAKLEAHAYDFAGRHYWGVEIHLADRAMYDVILASGIHRDPEIAHSLARQVLAATKAIAEQLVHEYAEAQLRKFMIAKDRARAGSEIRITCCLKGGDR